MRIGRSVTLRLLVLLSAAFAVSDAAASQSGDFAALCEAAAERVAKETDVPVSVLKAISLNETGRKRDGQFRPWAWTVNMEGKGHWFDTLDEARAYVFKEFKRGARSFDVGCFQINYKWHGQAFSSIDEMFDPLANGRYAAKFLRELFQEKGSWREAAGAYHSRTPKYADKYAQRFASFRAKFAGEDSSETDRAGAGYAAIPDIPDIVALSGQGRAAVRERVNTYPLFVREGPSRAGMGIAAGASLFATALSGQESE